ncbi:acyl-coenzyme A thioesterase THEM4 isoform X2 [Amia ocellicauda]|uniref:acyl-coenzyme A thioesterase THEM4 isoform X2 n=1 Tax=Amia ocellicauda TaxID=2972642 RepID=UPI003464C816
MLSRAAVRVSRALRRRVGHEVEAHLHRHAFTRPSPRSALGFGPRSIRGITGLPWVSSDPVSHDYSLPNPSWTPELRRLYEHYEARRDEGWKRLPSYGRSVTHDRDGRFPDSLIHPEARLFTRNLPQGSGFEYAVFVSRAQRSAVCICQCGPRLEGPPGHVHGGAIATIIDSAVGICATYISGFVLTANLNINYRSPVSLGSVILLDCKVERVEGRKTFVSCRVTSADGSTVHAEATGLFVSIDVKHLTEQ